MGEVPSQLNIRFLQIYALIVKAKIGSCVLFHLQNFSCLGANDLNFIVEAVLSEDCGQHHSFKLNFLSEVIIYGFS